MNSGAGALRPTKGVPVDIQPPIEPPTSAELRAMFAGHPLIDRVELALRHRGATDHASAERLLPAWPHADELSPRERLAVLARFEADAPGDTTTSTASATARRPVAPDEGLRLERPAPGVVVAYCGPRMVGSGRREQHGGWSVRQAGDTWQLPCADERGALEMLALWAAR